MKIGPIGTVCYRLLVEPALGKGVGNTVFVGLQAQDADERVPLLFSGLQRRVDVVRKELQYAPIFTGHLFGATGPRSARELASAMASMREFSPELVVGKEILDAPSP